MVPRRHAAHLPRSVARRSRISSRPTSERSCSRNYYRRLTDRIRASHAPAALAWDRVRDRLLDAPAQAGDDAGRVEGDAARSAIARIEAHYFVHDAFLRAGPDTRAACRASVTCPARSSRAATTSSARRRPPTPCRAHGPRPNTSSCRTRATRCASRGTRGSWWRRCSGCTRDAAGAMSPPATGRERNGLGGAQPRRRLASVHADEAARAHAARADRARVGRMAVRLRRPALPRRGQLVVGEPVRPREPAHQRGARRAARRARARDARRLHASRRSSNCPSGLPRWRRAGLVACVLRLRRRVGDRDRAQDELPLLAQQRGVPRQARITRASPAAITARPSARSSVTDVALFRDAYGPLLRSHPAAAVARRARRARRPRRRGAQDDALARARALSRSARRDDRRADRRAARAGRRRHGDVRRRAIWRRRARFATATAST